MDLKSGILEFVSIIAISHKRKHFHFHNLFQFTGTLFPHPSLPNTHTFYFPPNFGTSLISKLILGGPIYLHQTYSISVSTGGGGIFIEMAELIKFLYPPELILFPQSSFLPSPICTTMGHFCHAVLKVYDALLCQSAFKHPNHLFIFGSLSLLCP